MDVYVNCVDLLVLFTFSQKEADCLLLLLSIAKALVITDFLIKSYSHV